MTVDIAAALLQYLDLLRSAHGAGVVNNKMRIVYAGDREEAEDFYGGLTQSRPIL